MQKSKKLSQQRLRDWTIYFQQQAAIMWLCFGLITLLISGCERHAHQKISAPHNSIAPATLLAAQNTQIMRPASTPLWNDYVVVIENDGENNSPQFLQHIEQAGINGRFCRAIEPIKSLTLNNMFVISEALPIESNPLREQNNWSEFARTYAAQRNAEQIIARQPPLFDETVLNAARQALEKTVRAKRNTPILGWSLGDGLSVTNGAAPFDYDLAPDALELFRAWLETRYGSLEALNRQWGSRYAQWSEIQPLTTDKIKAAHNPGYAQCLHELLNPPTATPQTTSIVNANKTVTDVKKSAPQATKLDEECLAPGGENFSAWCDLQSFNDFAFSRLLREYRGWLRAQDESAPVGIIGSQPPAAFGGWDWRQLCQSVDWLEEHETSFTRGMLHSFAPKMRCVSKIFGKQAIARHELWDRWLRGDDGCILTRQQREINSQSDALFADLRELTRGVTLLRNSCQAVTDSIALYYSPRSVQLHWLLDSQRDGLNWRNRDRVSEAARNSARLQFQAWTMLLEDLGYSPRWLHPEQLMSGQLSALATKVVILPKVLSLSNAEAREFREYVRKGGIVIADGACGTFDGSGKRRLLALDSSAVGALDVDFGIARKDLIIFENNGEFNGNQEQSRVTLRDAVTNQPIGPDSADLRILEPGVISRSAWTHAASKHGAAALMSKSGGLGRFVYLNLCLQDYPSLCAKQSDNEFRFHGLNPQEYARIYGQPTGGEALRLVISDILATALPDNPLRARAEDGLPLRGLKRSQFMLGTNAYLFGLLPTANIWRDETGAARFDGLAIANRASIWAGLEKAFNWYDVLASKYLGYNQTIKTEIDPHRVTLLAALPYKVERLQLKSRRLDPRGSFELTVALQIDGGEIAQHVLRIEVFNPTSAPLPHYSQNARMENGHWRGRITLDANESVGRYRVIAQDIISGKSAEWDLLKE